MIEENISSDVLLLLGYKLARDVWRCIHESNRRADTPYIVHISRLKDKLFIRLLNMDNKVDKVYMLNSLLSDDNSELRLIYVNDTLIIESELRGE